MVTSFTLSENEKYGNVLSSNGTTFMIGQLVHKLQWKDTHIKKDSVNILRANSYPSHLLGKKVERNGININSEAL
jgi:sulfur carrier protein ThiS